jgi:hypothetical protein
MIGAIGTKGDGDTPHADSNQRKSNRDFDHVAHPGSQRRRDG